MEKLKCNVKEGEEQLVDLVRSNYLENLVKNNNNVPQEHIFIKQLKDILNEEMNKYRIIKDIEENKYVNEMAENLVRNVIKTFYECITSCIAVGNYLYEFQLFYLFS